MNLQEVIDNNLAKTANGKVADYIPALGQVAPKQLGVALYNLDQNELEQAGDANVRFAIGFLYAVKQLGLDEVTKHVGARQTGFPFNSILNLEIERAQHPLNPFINAGAIEVTSLIKPLADRQPFEQIIMFAREICHDPQITLNNEILNPKTGPAIRTVLWHTT
nr:glutaminase [Limosilactobacillus oris]